MITNMLKRAREQAKELEATINRELGGSAAAGEPGNGVDSSGTSRTPSQQSTTAGFLRQLSASAAANVNAVASQASSSLKALPAVAAARRGMAGASSSVLGSREFARADSRELARASSHDLARASSHDLARGGTRDVSIVASRAKSAADMASGNPVVQQSMEEESTSSVEEVDHSLTVTHAAISSSVDQVPLSAASATDQSPAVVSPSAVTDQSPAVVSLSAATDQSPTVVSLSAATDQSPTVVSTDNSASLLVDLAVPANTVSLETSTTSASVVAMTSIDDTGTLEEQTSDHPLETGQQLGDDTTDAPGSSKRAIFDTVELDILAVGALAAPAECTTEVVPYGANEHAFETLSEEKSKMSSENAAKARASETVQVDTADDVPEAGALLDAPLSQEPAEDSENAALVLESSLSSHAGDDVTALHDRTNALELASTAIRKHTKEHILQRELDMARINERNASKRNAALDAECAQLRRTQKDSHEEEIKRLSEELRIARTENMKVSKESSAESDNRVAELQVAPEQERATTVELRAKLEQSAASQPPENDTFRLEEQVRGLRLQVASTQAELNKTAEAHTRLKGEYEKQAAGHEEKLRKIKGLFAAANKTMSEQKQQIQKFEGDAQEKETALCDLTAENENLNAELQRARTDLANNTALRESAEQDTQRRLEKALEELDRVKIEYSAYKTRAHLALSDRAGSTSSKVSELERAAQRMDAEKRELLAVIEELKGKHAALGDQLTELTEQNDKLVESNRGILEQEERRREVEQVVRDLRNDITDLKSKHAEEMKDLGVVHASAVSVIREEFRRELQAMVDKLAAKESEMASLNTIMEKLEENIRESRAEANALRQQLDKARPVSAQKSPAPLDLSIGSAVGGAASSPAAPFEDLSRIVPLSPLLVSSAKEEYEEKLRAMSTMLSDCEQRIQQFAAQEQLLKDQLRKVDGVEQRANMNMEYLKNVIVKFLETPDVERDKFVVVFQQLLHLDDQEIARIKMALTNKQVGGWLF